MWDTKQKRLIWLGYHLNVIVNLPQAAFIQEITSNTYYNITIYKDNTKLLDWSDLSEPGVEADRKLETHKTTPYPFHGAIGPGQGKIGNLVGTNPPRTTRTGRN